MMNQQPFNAQMAAAVLRGLAGEFRSIQAIDPNEAGFVVRIRALEIRAAEQTIEALNGGAFNGQPWELRFRELAADYNAAAASQALSREQRVSLLRDFWWHMAGYCRAKCEGVVLGGKPRLRRVVEIGPPPAIPSPYVEPELMRLGLELPAEFAAEAGRSARLHAAFVCSTMADILAADTDNHHVPPKTADLRTGTQVEHLEQPKVFLQSEDAAVREVWNRLQKTPKEKWNISQTCREVAEEMKDREGRSAEVIRQTFNRWKRKNASAK